MFESETAYVPVHELEPLLDEVLQRLNLAGEPQARQTESILEMSAEQRAAEIKE
ncbi:MAG: hypothetical protein L0H94_04580 [Nitrospira sp.]|nr:hypothetical protein [Nitrospira sp.]